MNTMVIFSNWSGHFGQEMIIKFSTQQLSDAWMGNYECLNPDFLRAFRRWERHQKKGETLAHLLQKEMRSKDPHVSHVARFVWGNLRYQISTADTGGDFYRTPGEWARNWGYDNPYVLYCSAQEADRIE